MAKKSGLYMGTVYTIGVYPGTLTRNPYQLINYTMLPAACEMILR